MAISMDDLDIGGVYQEQGGVAERKLLAVFTPAFDSPGDDVARCTFDTLTGGVQDGVEIETPFGDFIAWGGMRIS